MVYYYIPREWKGMDENMRLEADDKSKAQAKKEEFTPVKNEKRSIKSEIAKMKAMGFKDGWEYFWSYYKVPVFIIIIVVAMVVSITVSVVRNSRPFIVQVHVYNNYLTDDADVTSLEEEFADYVGMNLNDYQINFDLTEYLDLNGTDESSYTSMMKVMAMVAAHDLDVIGGNTAFVNYYGVGEEDNTLFADLEEVLPTAFFQYLKEQDRILYLNRTDENGTVLGQYAAAIEVSDTRIVNKNYLQVTPCYLGVACNTSRLDNSIAFLEWIFDYQ